MSSLRRVVSVLFVLSFALPLSIGAANASGGTGSQRYHAPTSYTPLTPAQQKVFAKEQNAGGRMIVIMKNQMTSLRGRSRHMLATRASAIAATQKPVLNALTQMHATHVHAFSLINAISATISRPEAQYLRAQSGIRSVVPDLVLHLPAQRHPDGIAPRRARPAVRPASAVAKCAFSKPQIAPQALQLTNDAFTNPKTPQAQSIATGAGVNVAFMADGFDYFNPDFIRPNGSFVYSDVEDFSGSGGISPGGADEAMGDASSIAAQGNETYSVNNYVNSASPAKKQTPCPQIKVLGMAPGASLVGLQVFGSAGAFTSGFLQAIQYAVATGVNVLNESFGGNYYPDQANDPIALADEQAIADGVVVVASTGDAGTNGSNGSPSTFPGVIAVGATTQLQLYKQVGEQGFQLSNGKYLNNNVSGFSSGGPVQSGVKSVDVVAPGDLGWAVCDPAYCTDNNGLPSPIYDFGGTSESSPLTAGEAALVIQRYRETHGGATPTPAVVKDIIMSSATNLDLPASEQGAGLINALKAVQMAGSWGLSASKHRGEGLSIGDGTCLSDHAFNCNLALSASTMPGANNVFHFSLTNQGKSTQTVTPEVQTLTQFKSGGGTFQMNPAGDPSFVNSTGANRFYQSVTFNVPAHTAVLDTSAGFDIEARPGSILYLILLAPGGTYAGYAEPQGFGNGFTDLQIHDPAKGTWKIVFATRGASSSTSYIGPVNWAWTASKFEKDGTVSPVSTHVGVGGTKTFTAHVKTPSTSGDRIDDILVNGSTGSSMDTSMTIPVILRSLIPVSVAHGGSFKGAFTGGNARPAAGNVQTYQFDVPAGVSDFGISLALKDASTNYSIEGVLTDPNGTPGDTQSTVTGLSNQGAVTSVRNTLQFFQRSPVAGRWTLTLVIDFYSGPQALEPFTGTIGFNVVSATSNLPNSAGTMLTQGTDNRYTINVTNTGNTEELYFADPRLSTTTEYAAGSATNASNPGIGVGTAFTVPPVSSGLAVLAQATDSSSIVNLEVQRQVGAPPIAFATPDMLTSGTGGATLIYRPDEVPSGFWVAFGDDLNCPCNSPAENQVLTLQAAFATKTFDPDVSSDAGNIWGTGGPGLDLKPGQSGVINVDINPSQAANNFVTGNVYLETVQIAGPFGTTNYSGDEVAALPYSYTVAGTT